MNLYKYQRFAMPALLGWAGGSIIAGLLWLRNPERFWRGLGSQFAGWGLIDGLIAVLSLQGAAKKETAYAAGEIDEAEHARQSDQFERVIAANIALDAGYVAAGRWLKNRAPADDFQRGLGRGILIQGGFLLLWDILLLAFFHQQRRSPHV